MKSPAKPERKNPRKAAGASHGPKGARGASRASKALPKRRSGGGFSLPRRLTLWVASGLLLAALVAYPVSNPATRWGEVLAGAGVVVGFLSWVWRHRWIRWSLLAVLLGAGLFLVMPGRNNYDRPLLREETARAMRRFEGVPYWEGGENRYGIDGAGVVRRGVIDASLSYGLRTLNPDLVRRALQIWWSDGSNRATQPGGRFQTRRVAQMKSVRLFYDGVLFPGDFVLLNGKEPMAYLGHHRWLLADPKEGKVVLLRKQPGKPVSILAPAPKPTDVTPFDQPGTLIRWRVLEARRMERPRPY